MILVLWKRDAGMVSRRLENFLLVQGTDSLVWSITTLSGFLYPRCQFAGYHPSMFHVVLPSRLIWYIVLVYIICTWLLGWSLEELVILYTISCLSIIIVSLMGSLQWFA